MDVVTWNLNGLEPIDLDPRAEGAMFLVLLGDMPERVVQTGRPRPPPDVILLQEVVERSFHAAIAPHLRAAGYTVFPEQPPERGYFEVIAVRGPVRDASIRPFSRTGMGRCLTRVELPGCTVYTGHLESLGPGRPARMAQCAEVLAAMAACRGPAIFGGDTNLRRAEWDELLVPPGITDAWETLGAPAATARTWQRARYDRFWLQGFTPTALSLVGDRPLPATGARASDHLGLRLTVR
jgi:endonuclease/exonuclease/phosphatase (EEP) superfamily protein YafD